MTLSHRTFALRHFFLMSSCAAIIAAPAVAQSSTPAPEPTAKTGPTVGGIGEDSIVVTARRAAGGGMMTDQTALAAQTTLTQAFITKQLPAANALQVLKLTPGANIGQSDSYGISERADFSFRGFDQVQIGVVVDGMPQGDPNTYLATVNEWFDNENVSSLTVTQGTTDVGTPTLTATGGLISASVRDPADSFGGLVRYAAGSFNANRGFFRVDTGEIGKTGIKTFVSYSRVDADNFRGAGSTSRTHIDGKAVKDFSNGSRISAIYTHNALYNERTNIPTLAQFEQFGKSFNYSSNYVFGDTNYYKYYPYYRRSDAVSLPSKIVLSDSLTVKETPYFRHIFANGPGATSLALNSLYVGTTKEDGTTLPVANAVNGRIQVLSSTNTTQTQTGNNLSLVKQWGDHTITLGYWFDYTQHKYNAGYQQINQDGSVSGGNLVTGNPLRFGNGNLLSGTHYVYGRYTNVGYVLDQVSLLNDQFKIIFGARLQNVLVRGTNYLPGPQDKVRVNRLNVMPRVGISYFSEDHKHQIFANATTNARPPLAGSTYFDTYNVSTGRRSVVGNPNVKPEYAISEEVGYRYKGFFNASITFFNSNIKNHQVNTLLVNNGVQVQSQISAGGQTIRGIDAEFALHSYKGFAPYVTAEYLHATTDDDLPVGNDFLPTKGKTSVRSPKFQGSVGLMYDREKALFGSLNFKYVASQYSTFMADQKMPHYYQTDVSIGYRLPSVGFVKTPVIQLNVMNLFNRSYLGSIASPTANALATVGRNGTIIAASQPGYYEASTRTIMGSVSFNF